MSWLTAKVMQYIAGALLLGCIGLGLRGCALSDDVAVAVADKGKAEADRDAAVTSRDSWKSKAEDALAANRAYDAAFAQLQEAAAEQQRLAGEAAKKAAAAVATAQRDEAQAERQLADFKRRSGNKPATCAAALQAMQAACPMLEGF